MGLMQFNLFHQEGAQRTCAPPPPFRRLRLAGANFCTTVINAVDTSATYLRETTSSTGRAQKHEKEAGICRHVHLCKVYPLRGVYTPLQTVW